MERLELSEAQVEVTHVSQRRARARGARATNFSPLTSSNVVANTRGAQNPFSALTLRRTYDGSDRDDACWNIHRGQAHCTCVCVCPCVAEGQGLSGPAPVVWGGFAAHAGFVSN